MGWRVMFRSPIKQLCLTGLASLLALSITTSGLTGTAHAESAESIRDFRNDITLLADGSAIIKETILYDFGTNQKHGLLRDIATSAILPSGKYFNYAITISSVTRNGQEESHKESQISSYLESKIGDPDATITGQHTYEITYSVDRVIQHDPAGDYLNWDIVGTQFKVPIEKSHTEIHVPSDIPLLDGMRCYTGGQGATASNCQIEKQGQNVIITTGNLSAREGATVNLLM